MRGCIELFAGAGGAALGLEAAGWHHLALCEWNGDACATMRAAGLGPVVEGDVRDLDAIEAVAGPRCDLLWSSFPCQAFSTAGKRQGAADERNGWPWTVDAIDRFQPRWFLAENVRGLLCHTPDGCGDPFRCPRCYFDAVILAGLRERFKCVGWWVLDAADFGLSQHRSRLFIWAGPAPIRVPQPTHTDPATVAQRLLFGPSLRPWVSCGDALGVTVAKRNQNETGIPVEQRQEIDCTGRPAPTISASYTVGLAGYPYVIEGNTRRPLTVAELGQLQDFPRAYPFVGSLTSQRRQLGNAVPPRLAEVVGRAVIEAETAGV